MENFPVMLEKDDNGTVLVDFVDFPFAHTFGKTEGEAMKRAVDALVSAIIGLMTDRKDVPRPSSARGRRTVSLPPLDAAKIELYRAMRKQGVTKAELGRRLQWHPPQIDRLLDLRHASKLDQLEHALRAVGKTLIISVRDAA